MKAPNPRILRETTGKRDAVIIVGVRTCVPLSVACLSLAISYGPLGHLLGCSSESVRRAWRVRARERCSDRTRQCNMQVWAYTRRRACPLWVGRRVRAMFAGVPWCSAYHCSRGAEASCTNAYAAEYSGISMRWAFGGPTGSADAPCPRGRSWLELN